MASDSYVNRSPVRRAMAAFVILALFVYSNDTKRLEKRFHKKKGLFTRRMRLRGGSQLRSNDTESLKGLSLGGNSYLTRQKNSNSTVSMDDVINLAKRKGFVFPSSEIYEGFAGFYDYGPLGTEMRRNIRSLWWNYFVQRRPEIVGIETAIVSPAGLWRASGHLQNFADPIVTCKVTGAHYRADHIFYAEVSAPNGTCIGYVSTVETDSLSVSIKSSLRKRAVQLAKSLLIPSADVQIGEVAVLADIDGEDKSVNSLLHKIPSPATLLPNTMTPPRPFNLMFSTTVGPSSTNRTDSIAYLRPETAQGIFCNFRNLLATSRLAPPFGIAQIGKAFRNEISARNFVFRSREFEQMEIEYFVSPDTKWEPLYEEWINDYWHFLVSIGLIPHKLARDVHKGDKLAHYAKACTDITFKFPFGAKELMGIAVRGSYDLRAHQNASGQSFEYFNVSTNERYIPHVIEPSLGLDRLFLALLVSAYDEDRMSGEIRKVLRLHPKVAPIKVAVFPLIKKPQSLVQLSQQIRDKLSSKFNVFWDTSGAIGRRYRRMDEVGTPLCVTVDHRTLEDETVTVRDRDSGKQDRINITHLESYVDDWIESH